MLTPELQKKVRRLHIKTNHLVNAVVAGNYHSAFRGKGMEFQEVRQYVAGDDVRDIDWNVTARLGDPYIKIYQEERELSVMLIVDMSGSGLFGSTGYVKRELIAEIAAVLAFSAIKNNDKVGLLLFTDKIERLVLPKKGRGHVWRVIREILDFQSTHRRTDIQQALNFFNRLAIRRGVAFVISDFIDNKPFKEALQLTSRRHDLIGIQVSDPLEEKLPNLGLLEVEDPESGTRRLIDTADAKQRHQLQALALQHRQMNRTLFTRSGATLVNVDCTADYLKDLVMLFHRRERHGRMRRN